jgi:hypothetical protein
MRSMETSKFYRQRLSILVVVWIALADQSYCVSAPPEDSPFKTMDPATSQTAARDSCNVKPIYRSTIPYKNKPSQPTIDWTTMPSTYTHSPAGDRVDQFAETQPPVTVDFPPVTRSGFRHSRSTLQAGFSSDNYHSVEQWGPNVRPYGEWRYPTRPFSVPYNAWGPQLPLAVGSFPWGGFSGPLPPPAGPFGLQVVPGNVAPGQGPLGVVPNHPGLHFGVGPHNALQPTQDDYYPQAPTYHPIHNGLE